MKLGLSLERLIAPWLEVNLKTADLKSGTEARSLILKAAKGYNSPGRVDLDLEAASKSETPAEKHGVKEQRRLIKYSCQCDLKLAPKGLF